MSRKMLDLLEENIRSLCSQASDMSHFDLANSIMLVIKAFLEMETHAALLNKVDYESIRGSGINFVAEQGSFVRWQSEGPSHNTLVTHEQVRNLALIQGTINFLHSKGYLTKPIKINIE